MKVVDAHAHLWLRQQGKVDGRDVFLCTAPASERLTLDVGRSEVCFP